MARGRHSHRSGVRAWKIALVAVGVLAVMSGGTAFAAYRFETTSSDRILPGVAIAGLDVSDMSRSEAVSEVTALTQATLEQQLTVTAGGSTWTATPASLGMTADVEGAVDRAFAVADSMPLLDRVYHRVADKPVDASIDVLYSYDDAAVRRFVEQARDEVAVSAVNARFALVDDQLVMRRSSEGQAMQTKLAVTRIHDALEQSAASVTLPIETVEPETNVAGLGKTIVVDISSTTLTLYDGFKVEKQYRVATAAPGYVTPVGNWKIVNKVENPTWYNPAPDGWGAGEPLVIPPGPGNPLGTRALYLNAPGIRIHGTYSSSSIGTHASHGCIRMYITDSEELFPLVPVGTRVIIAP
jgi:lipoprotein-anchoring transpeptidase ErfK/SrfK